MSVRTRHFWKWYLILTVLFVSGTGCVVSQAAMPATALEQVRKQIHAGAPAALSAGASRVEITPTVGTPLAGYGKRKGKPSVGIRDPLYVRALALNDGTDTVALISADLLVFPPPVADRIIRRVAREHNLPRQAIVLAATHTHSGTGSIGHGFLYEQVFGNYQEEVVEGISGRVSWAVGQALANRKPAQWAVAHRRGFLEGSVENRAKEGGPVDPDLSVLFLRGTDGSPLAILVSAAAHPTLLEWRDMRFSGDFPGEVSRQMESAYPGAVCLFVNGAAGDSRPRDAIGVNADQRVERFGGLLAEGAQGLISGMEPKSRADLAAWGLKVPLPKVQVQLGPIPVPSQIGSLMRPTSEFMSVVSLDGTLLTPLSAELTAELGTELKSRLRRISGREPFLLGYANGYLGYAVTPETYGGKSYEAWMSWYGKEFGPYLLEQMEHLAGLFPEGGEK